MVIVLRHSDAAGSHDSVVAESSSGDRTAVGSGSAEAVGEEFGCAMLVSTIT